MTTRSNSDGRSTRDRVTFASILVVMAMLALQPAMTDRAPDRQSEFAWEMFSKSAPREEFVIDFGDRSTTVSPADVVDPARANVEYPAVLPRWLCEQNPSVESVTTLRNDEVIARTDCTAR